MKLIEWIATGVVLVFAGIGLTLVLVFVAKKIKKAHERKSECEKIQFLLHKNKELKKAMNYFCGKMQCFHIKCAMSL